MKFCRWVIQRRPSICRCSSEARSYRRSSAARSRSRRTRSTASITADRLRSSTPAARCERSARSFSDTPRIRARSRWTLSSSPAGRQKWTGKRRTSAAAAAYVGAQPRYGPKTRPTRGASSTTAEIAGGVVLNRTPTTVSTPLVRLNGGSRRSRSVRSSSAASCSDTQEPARTRRTRRTIRRSPGRSSPADQ